MHNQSWLISVLRYSFIVYFQNFKNQIVPDVITLSKSMGGGKSSISCLVVDDDVYGFLSPELPPISNFTASDSFYLTSFSKSVFPGLRVAYIAAPEQYKARIDAQIRLSIWMHPWLH